MHTDAAARRPARLSIGASHPAIMLIGQWPVGSHAPGTAKTLVGVHDTLLGTHRQAKDQPVATLVSIVDRDITEQRSSPLGILGEEDRVRG